MTTLPDGKNIIYIFYYDQDEIMLVINHVLSTKSNTILTFFKLNKYYTVD